MKNHALAGLTLLVLASVSCGAAEPVFGPPKLLINAQIIEDGGNQPARLTASFLSWDESRQNWTRSAKTTNAKVPQAFRNRSISMQKSRSIIVLQSEEFNASVPTLSFSRLDGERVDPKDVPKLLEAKRAVAFLPKGCAIHPMIAATLHPETLVITRRSYPEDPIVIPLPSSQ